MPGSIDSPTAVSSSRSVRLDAERGADPVVAQGDELGDGRWVRRFSAGRSSLGPPAAAGHSRSGQGLDSADGGRRPRRAPSRGVRTFAAGQPADADARCLRQRNEAFAARFGLATQPFAEGGGRHTRRTGQPIRTRPVAQDRLQSRNERRARAGMRSAETGCPVSLRRDIPRSPLKVSTLLGQCL